MKHVEHPHVFEHRGAACPGAFGQRESDFFGNHLAIVRQPRRAEQVVHPQQRPFFPGGFGTDQLHFDAEPFRHGGGAAQLRHSFLRLCDDQAAHLFPADRVAGFLFQTGVKLGAVFIDFGHAIGRAKTPDQTGGVPGGAAGQLVLLEQHDILPAEFRKVISDTAANNATADDDDLGFFGRSAVHNRSGVYGRAVFSQYPVLGSDCSRAPSYDVAGLWL